MQHALKFTLAAVVTVLLCITIGAQERERGSAQRAPATAPPPARDIWQDLVDRAREIDHAAAAVPALERELARLRDVVTTQGEELASQRRALDSYRRALQDHLREHDAGGEEPPAPPRPPRPRPGPQPPPDVGGWPTVPDVRIGLDPRGPPAEQLLELAGAAAEWTIETGWRHSTAYAELADLAVFTWREQWAGWDATRVTVAVVNGFPGRGTAYLEGIRIEVAGAAPLARAERDCILPRGTFLRRFFVGPQADALRAWQHVEPAGPTLEWIPAVCETGRARRAAEAKAVGPYLVGDPNVQGSSSLPGSHGGRRLAPYWGGEDGHQATCREGLRAMAEGWLFAAARSPVALLERGTGAWRNPRASYWPGSTIGHEPPGYAIAQLKPGGEAVFLPLDGWCPYEAELRTYRPHDHTHYRRAFAEAAGVARHDVAARWFLAMLWGNLAAWLDGAPSTVGLLQWGPQLLEVPAHQGDSRGGRGWGHTLGCFLAAEPWLPAELAGPSWGGTWREALARITEHWSRPNGWVHATGREGFPLPQRWQLTAGGELVLDAQGKPIETATWKASGWAALDDPVAASRELDLVGVWLAPLGLAELDAAWRRSLAPVQRRDGTWLSVGEHLESRDVAHWSAVDYRAPNAQPEYDLFRGEFGRWGGIEGVIEAARLNPTPDELLLANLPRQVWQATIR